MIKNFSFKVKTINILPRDIYETQIDIFSFMSELGFGKTANESVEEASRYLYKNLEKIICFFKCFNHYYQESYEEKINYSKLVKKLSKKKSILSLERKILPTGNEIIVIRIDWIKKFSNCQKFPFISYDVLSAKVVSYLIKFSQNLNI